MHNHISVVVPAYNEAEMIETCFEALSSQSRQPDVVYVIDNNSTDQTRDVAEKYDAVVVSEPIQGICAATHAGFEAASQHNGIILRCDADCRPNRDWIEKVEAIFDANPGAAAVTGPGEAYDVGMIKAALIDFLYMKPYFVFVKFALGRKPLFGSNFGIRSEAWKHISASTHLRMRQNIHDDIDISYHIKGSILFSEDIKMPISARPFKSVKSLIKRYAAGFRSILIHWPEQAPWKTW